VLVSSCAAAGDVRLTVPATTSGWTVGAVVVAALAVIAALFKDELWHWMHRARLEVVAVRGSGPFEVELQLRNPSNRTAAEGVTARIIQMEDHPIEYSLGPKWMPRLTPLDQLLPRISGETMFALAPLGQVRLPLLTFDDGWTSADPALARIATAKGAEGGEDGSRGDLVVLPNADQRGTALENHPGLRRALSSPAMIRMEVAATNVPARLFTLKLWRSLERPPAGQMPMSPYLRAGAFSWELVDGYAPYNWAPHGSSSEAAESPGGEEDHDEPDQSGWWPILTWCLSAAARRGRPRPKGKPKP
jgi:hypothetical protein